MHRSRCTLFCVPFDEFSALPTLANRGGAITVQIEMLLARESHGQATWSGGLDDLAGPVRPHLGALSERLADEAARFDPSLQELVRYSIAHSGKRIRPVLVFLSGYHAGAPRPALVQAAAVVELVHLATLVHDDILDEAKLRHKSTTVSAQYGPAVAVLLGDAMFAHALELAASYPTPDVCRLVAVAARQVCAGEVLQNFRRGRTDLSRADYYRIIDGKTADLFRVSCELGALLGDYPAAFVAAAARFGRHLGLAYQIFDDLADYLGDEARIGKTLGTDLVNGKYTLPTLLAFQAMPPATRAGVVAGLSVDDPAARQTLLSFATSPAVMREATQAFRDELAAASAALAPFVGLPPVEHLARLPLYVEQLFRSVVPAEFAVAQPR